MRALLVPAVLAVAGAAVVAGAYSGAHANGAGGPTGPAVAPGGQAVLGRGDAGGAPEPPGAMAVWPGRTTTVVIEDDVGRPLEREPDFAAAAPSYRRAIASDGDQRWFEATGSYQQALLEAGAAARVATPARLEAIAFKIELERRRSRVLAEDDAARRSVGARPGVGAAPARLLPLERARLLRSKMMAVRAVTGHAPAPLRTATLGALARALLDAERGAAAGDRSAPPIAEVRLWLCATLGTSGDRPTARQQLDLVPAAHRGDPARALSLAACQVALGYRDDALASLAVALNRLGPSSRFLPGPTRELESANDWDPLRPDPRFARLFH